MKLKCSSTDFQIFETLRDFSKKWKLPKLYYHVIFSSNWVGGKEKKFSLTVESSFDHFRLKQTYFSSKNIRSLNTISRFDFTLNILLKYHKTFFFDKMKTVGKLYSKLFCLISVLFC